MKLMIGLLAAAILGTGGFAFAAGLDDSQQARTVSLPGLSTSDDTTTAATTTDDIVIGNAPATTTDSVDISGPCDEAEHANDPRCTGAVDETTTTAATTTTRDPAPGDDDHDDRSGPNRWFGPRQRRRLRRRSMIRIKLGILTLLALVASSVTLAAVAQSAATAQTVRVTEVSYGIRFSAKPKAGTVKFQVRNGSATPTTSGSRAAARPGRPASSAAARSRASPRS